MILSVACAGTGGGGPGWVTTMLVEELGQSPLGGGAEGAMALKVVMALVSSSYGEDGVMISRFELELLEVVVVVTGGIAEPGGGVMRMASSPYTS